MIVIGIIALIVGLILGIHVVYIIGAALLVIGAVLALLGTVAHRPIAGRKHWF